MVIKWVQNFFWCILFNSMENSCLFGEIQEIIFMKNAFQVQSIRVTSEWLINRIQVNKITIRCYIVFSRKKTSHKLLLSVLIQWLEHSTMIQQWLCWTCLRMVWKFFSSLLSFCIFLPLPRSLALYWLFCIVSHHSNVLIFRMHAFYLIFPHFL